MHRGVIRETVVSAAASRITSSEHTEYVDSKGGKDSRRKKSKRRRKHRKSEKCTSGKDTIGIPSVFRVQSDNESPMNGSDSSELSRVVLPQLTNLNQFDTQRKRSSEKQQDKQYHRHTLPKISTSGSLTTGSRPYFPGVEEFERKFALRSRCKEEWDVDFAVINVISQIPHKIALKVWIMSIERIIPGSLKERLALIADRLYICIWGQ